MRTTMKLLLATSALAFSTGAMAADNSYKAETSITKGDRGGYERTTKMQSDEGSVKRATEVNVDRNVSRDGDVKETTTVEKTVDPKGLWNKETEKVKEVRKTVDGKTTVESKHTLNGDTISEKKAN